MIHQSANANADVYRKRAYEFIVQIQGTIPEDIPESKLKLRKLLKKTLDIVSDRNCYKPLKVTIKVPVLSDNRTHPMATELLESWSLLENHEKMEALLTITRLETWKDTNHVRNKVTNHIKWLNPRP